MSNLSSTHTHKGAMQTHGQSQSTGVADSERCQPCRLRNMAGPRPTWRPRRGTFSNVKELSEAISTKVQRGSRTLRQINPQTGR